MNPPLSAFQALEQLNSIKEKKVKTKKRRIIGNDVTDKVIKMESEESDVGVKNKRETKKKLSSPPKQNGFKSGTKHAERKRSPDIIEEIDVEGDSPIKSNKKRKKRSLKCDGGSIFNGATTNGVNLKQINEMRNKSLQINPKGKSTPFSAILSGDPTGNEIFATLLSPIISTTDFFKSYWEVKSLHFERSDPNFYSDLFTVETLEEIIRDCDVQYGVNIDVTKFVDQRRMTFNPPGKAIPATVWNYFRDGCSVRLLNPQSYSANVWKVCSRLQHTFNTFVGANVYYTPRGTQGFAPHWDDIDAFIMQLHGTKLWRVYAPSNDEQKWPLESSGNFRDDELGVEPVIKVWLKPGDMIYIPRGHIHQAEADPNSDSLHITLSACHNNTYSQLFTKTVEAALEKTIVETPELRRSMPVDFLNKGGALWRDRNYDIQGAEVCDSLCDKMEWFGETLVSNLQDFVHAAVDQMAKEYQHTALPHFRVKTGKDIWIGDMTGINDIPPVITHITPIKLLEKNCLRLVEEVEDGLEKWRVYFCVQNSRVYKERQATFMQLDKFDEDVKQAIISVIDVLDQNYPQFVSPKDIRANKMNISKINLMKACSIFFQQGLIVMKK